MIINEIQYEKVCERVEQLLQIVSSKTPLDDINSVELELLSHLVADYEEKYHPILPPTVAEILKDRMMERKLSQNNVAKLLGISASRVSEYLNGKAEPTLKIARIMCKEFDISPSVILGLQ